ncbi:integrase catalytic domain-containing protein [Trichonephila inaurata madagascariensis]|uniref:Integrase catalytic domain-containing protein n=1 Tax=Trichonephila inaurata madagascariensis TaxID=2747483 RepID=A0A8X6XDU6_9ARAC|nr:integrase catalytic domain-containing protein [Trichonephila inaurata madagascariensis]
MHDTDLSFTCLENMKISVPLANSTQSRSGKPLKRRRIISDPTVLPPFKRANPKMLRHAISKANVTPMNDMEVQNIQAMNDTALPSSSRKHMKNSVPLKNSAQSRFSNAHQSGRPLQRMKLFIGDPTVRPPSKCSLQEMLLHATSKANVTPVTDMELLRNEAMKDVALQSSFLAVVTLLWSQTQCRNPGTTEEVHHVEKADGKEDEVNCKDIFANHLMVENEEFDFDRVRNLWSLETIGINPDNEVPLSDKEVLKSVEQNTVYRNKRYETGLLWKEDIVGN